MKFIQLTKIPLPHREPYGATWITGPISYRPPSWQKYIYIRMGISFTFKKNFLLKNFSLHMNYKFGIDNPFSSPVQKQIFSSPLYLSPLMLAVNNWSLPSLCPRHETSTLAFDTPGNISVSSFPWFWFIGVRRLVVRSSTCNTN